MPGWRDGAPAWLAWPYMRVVVGPVSRESARAWLGYARSVVDELSDIAPGQCFTTPEVLAVFSEYLDSWDRAARRSGDFFWEDEIATEQVEYHMHSFHQVAGMLRDRQERLGAAQAPDEGDAFYLALLNGVLSALETESASSAEFAQHLGRFWPGQEMSIR